MLNIGKKSAGSKSIVLDINKKAREKELAATEIAIRVVWTLNPYHTTTKYWNFDAIKDLIEELTPKNDPQLKVMVWQDTCFLLLYFNNFDEVVKHLKFAKEE